MTRRFSRRALLGSGAVAVSAGLTGCLDALSPPSPAEQLREHEESLARFSDVVTAIDEGYQTAGTYVRTDDGVLGIPFVNTDVRELDPEQPQAILYGLTAAGQYEPLGLKWFAPTEGQDGPPSLFGRELSGPYESETALIPEHYALHAWLFRENPDGLFARYNAAVDPPELVDRIEPVRATLDEYAVGSEVDGNGYTNTEKCIATGDGGYGVPFVRDGTDDTGGTDPEKPPVLLYRLTQAWTYQLVGAEWYVPVSEADEPPTLFGQRFHEPADGHSPKTDQPRHYGLHAWFFRANPRGMFTPLNPTLSCG